MIADVVTGSPAAEPSCSLCAAVSDESLPRRRRVCLRETGLDGWALLSQHGRHANKTRSDTYFSPGISRRLVRPVQLISKSCKKKKKRTKIFHIQIISNFQIKSYRLFLYKNTVLQLILHSRKHRGHHPLLVIWEPSVLFCDVIVFSSKII